MNTFLCPKHRQWVFNNSHQALKNSYATQDKGNELLNRGETEQAMKFFGCAYEVVEIYIHINGKHDHQQVSRLTTLCLQTAQCFFEMGEFDEEKAMLDRAITQLRMDDTAYKSSEALTAFRRYCITSLKECLSYATYYVQRHNRSGLLH